MQATLFISRFLRALHSVIKIVTGMTLAYMALLAITQLLLRWLFNTGFGWADLQLRQMVLYIGLLGGVLAAAENRHVKIDLVTHYLHGKTRLKVQRFVHLISAVCCLCLAYTSIMFVISEFQASAILRGVFFGVDIQQGYFELLIPTAFFFMALFFLDNAFKRPPASGLDK